MKVNQKRMHRLFLALAIFAVAFAPFPNTVPTRGESRTFRIEAGQFLYSPSEITVNPGDRVTIELVSKDVVHGLYVDDYGVSITADPGQTAILTFTANKPGSFRFRCNITCGAMHPFMIGKLNVGSNGWLYRSMGLAAIAMVAVTAFRKPQVVGSRTL